MQGKPGEGNVPQVKERKLLLRRATHINKLKTERNCKYIKDMFYWGYARKYQLKLWLNFVNVYISKWICACLRLSSFSFFKFADTFAASYFYSCLEYKSFPYDILLETVFWSKKYAHPFVYLFCCCQQISLFYSYFKIKVSHSKQPSTEHILKQCMFDHFLGLNVWGKALTTHLHLVPRLEKE